MGAYSMKATKEHIIMLIIGLLVLIAIIPVKRELKDGGSVQYTAIAYTITKVKQLNPDINSGKTYLEGYNIKIFGIEVYDNVE